jgi:hypothetical protein
VTAAGALLGSAVLALLLVSAWSKPVRTRVGGLLSRDKKGRMVLVLSPAKKRSKSKGKRKR